MELYKYIYNSFDIFILFFFLNLMNDDKEQRYTTVLASSAVLDLFSLMKKTFQESSSVVLLNR